MSTVPAPVAPGLLTAAQAAPLLGKSRRRVAEMMADGWFPAGCVVRSMGKGKRRSHARLVLQRLIEARLVLPIAHATSLLCLCLTAHAAELRVDQPSAFYDPDASHHGRHLIGGALLGATLYAGTSLATDDQANRYLVAIGGTAVVAAAYELARGRDGSSYVDPVDVAWTTLGGAVGALCADATGDLFTITPRRDGASLTVAWAF